MYKVLLFGRLQEVAGGDHIVISDHLYNLSELRRWVEDRYPPLQRLKYIVSINKKIETGDLQINPEDEIALLPPFSGG